MNISIYFLLLIKEITNNDIETVANPNPGTSFSSSIGVVLLDAEVLLL